MSSAESGPRLHGLPFEASAAARPNALQRGAGLLLLGLAAAAVIGFPAARIGLATLLGLVVLAVSLLRIGVTLASPVPGPPDPLLPEQCLPSYSLLVPLYREAEVVSQLIAALRRLDYPAHLLQVLLLVEAEDAATRAALTAEGLPPGWSVLVLPPGAPLTKPRALSFALPLAGGDLLTVYDAEDLPEPDQLRRAAARFAARPELTCLQARLAIDNPEAGWLAALFAVEYAVLFDVVNPGLARLGLPLLLGGTSNHFRTPDLRLAGGWDPWNVTEDADLGLRLARLGMKVDVLDSTTQEEAPARLQAWLRQRRRWMKGWLQTFLVHSRDLRGLWRDPGSPALLTGLALLANGLITSILGLACSALLWADLSQGPVHFVWIANAGLGGVAVLLPLALALRRRGLARWWPVLWLAPLRWALLTFAAWCALVDLRRRPFHWGTTRHGLAPRRAASVDLADPAF